MYGDESKFIKLDNNKTIIKQDGIQYIQKDGMKVIFHTDTRDYETYSSFKKIMSQLPSQFVQCHKSYIVNTKKITVNKKLLRIEKVKITTRVTK